MSEATDAILAELRAFGLAYPGAHSKAPWPEHDDLAVNDKTFAYLPVAGQPFSLSVKLPYTGEVALDLPYAKPTAYGLGKSGWVSFTPSGRRDAEPGAAQGLDRRELPGAGAEEAGEGAGFALTVIPAKGIPRRLDDPGDPQRRERSPSPPPRSRRTAAAPRDRISAT